MGKSGGCGKIPPYALRVRCRRCEKSDPCPHRPLMVDRLFRLWTDVSSYEKAAEQWAKPWKTHRKLYAVITVIKRALMDTWTPEVLLTFLEDCRCRSDTLFGTY